MKILITGASSYVGARIYRDLSVPFELAGTYNTNQLFPELIQLDLTDYAATQSLIEDVVPAVIVHNANHPGVIDVSEAIYTKLNSTATKTIVTAAETVGAKVVFVSSQAALQPNDIYGQQKLVSENIIKESAIDFFILRPSLVLGYSPNTTNARTFNYIYQMAIDETYDREFDTSWRFRPTYIGHLSQLITQIIQRDDWNQICSIYLDHVITKHQVASDILMQYNRTPKGFDGKSTLGLAPEDFSVFERFDLEPLTYDAMVETIVKEIKEAHQLSLNNKI